MISRFLQRTGKTTSTVSRTVSENIIDDILCEKENFEPEPEIIDFTSETLQKFKQKKINKVNCLICLICLVI